MIKKIRRINTQLSFYYSIILLFLIFVTGIVLYYFFSTIIIDMSINDTKMSVENGGKYMESYIDKIFQISSLLMSSKELKTYIDSDDALMAESIENDVKTIVENDEFIESIFIVLSDGRMLSSEQNLNFSLSSDMMDENWYIKASDSMPYLTSTRMNRFTMDKDKWVISISTVIQDENDKNIGVVLIDIDYLFVEEHMLSMSRMGNSEVYIFDNTDCLVYHKDTSYFDDTEKAECLAMEVLDSEGFDRKSNTLTYRYDIKNADWKLVSVSELTELNMVKQEIIIYILAASIVMIVLVVLLGTRFAMHITQPIKKLESAMSEKENKLINIDTSNKYSSEIISLTNHYNDMITRINKLMKDNAEKEIKVRESEIKALTSQINPHFLYNTLDAILWMAEDGNTEGVVDMIKALGNFFRLSLSGGRAHITIRDEIQHVKEYLYIQKVRYGEKLTYSFDLDESIMDIKIPKIILQPIVENAIYHGIKELDTTGHINIKSEKKGKFINFVITDNGVGFDKNSLDKSDDKLKLSGVGLKNINQRLKLHYCDNCGVEIDSKIGAGTTVKLKVNLSLV